MLLAAENNYPLLEVIWTIIVFFAWVIWIWTVISVLGDIFRRHDLSGWGKAGWTFVIILIPFLGVLIYLISQGEGMAHRNVEMMAARQETMEQPHPRGRGNRRRRRRRDRQRQGSARERRHHPGGVRAAQAQGAGLSTSTPARIPLQEADAARGARMMSPATKDARPGPARPNASVRARDVPRAPAWCAVIG